MNIDTGKGPQRIVCLTLLPEPAALTDSVRQLHAIVQRWAENR